MAASATSVIPCSIESLQYNEPLIGTAPRADVWFLLEYSGRWGNKALKESSIPDEVKAHLKEQLETIPYSRLLLTKKSPRPNDEITFFAALSVLNLPRLYKFHLSNYTELLDFDLAAIASQDLRYEETVTTEDLFVICTNGLRDTCCSLHGTVTYNAIRADYGDILWQSTHHGGHRFAANLLHLPHGHSFGRLRPENATSVLESALERRIALEHYRGRSIFPEPVQAAEILLRQKLGVDRINVLTLSSAEQESESWKVQFSENGRFHEVRVSVEESAEMVLLSCGDKKTSPIKHFRLVEHSLL